MLPFVFRIGDESLAHQAKPHLLSVLECRESIFTQAAHFPATPGYSDLAPVFYIPACLFLLLGLCFSQISSSTSVCNSLKSKSVTFNLKITFEAFTASFIQTFYLYTSAHLSTDAFFVMQDQSYKQDYYLIGLSCWHF